MCFRISNPRKGTETSPESSAEPGQWRSFRISNPRKGTETIRSASGWVSNLRVSAYLIPARGLKHLQVYDYTFGHQVSAYLIPARGLKLSRGTGLDTLNSSFRISNPRKGTETHQSDAHSQRCLCLFPHI